MGTRRIARVPRGAPSASSTEPPRRAAAEKAARSKYAGDAYNKGEVARSASLGRAFPDFDALCADGRFEAFAESLLSPLLRAIVRNDTKEPKKDAKKDKAAPHAAGVDE